MDTSRGRAAYPGGGESRASALFCSDALPALPHARREEASTGAGPSLGYPGALDEMLLGASPAIRDAKRLIARVAESPAPTVLITGESGTGKDVAARALHELSTRRSLPFVNITCSALPDALLETELFGHERGAFTDAHQRKLGLAEQAAGGTLFLDEIGEMAPALQAKLLRFVESRTFRRVGGTSDVQADVRVVAATHRKLRDQVQAGAFRHDLYYRLTVFHIHLPPLRERNEDVPLLASRFVASFAQTYGRCAGGVSAAALDMLRSHTWPGNVRELKNVLERAVLLTDHEQIRREDLAFADPDPRTVSYLLPEGGVELEALERDIVAQALARTNGNKTRAAALLGLTRDQIRHRIEKFALDEGRG